MFAPRWRRKAAQLSGWCVRTTIREMMMYLRQVAAALAGALVLAGAVATDATAQRRDRDDDRRGRRRCATGSSSGARR